jgi:hypothetical protein
MLMNAIRTPKNVVVLVASVLLATQAAAAVPDQLARARQLYNQRQFDAAIATAQESMRRPETAAPAAVVFARAHLERFRQNTNAADLTAAREALSKVDTVRLPVENRTELLVGWAELFYLEGHPGDAADLFDAALARADVANLGPRDRILDWWAQALEKLALEDVSAGRERTYARILAKMEREDERTPDSQSIIYWLAAAARGAGDLDRAWYAARAGWIRARLTARGGVLLRGDLDRLVVGGIIPDRAKLYGSADEAKRVSDEMMSEWETLKKAW